MTDYDLWKTTPPEYPEPEPRLDCSECPHFVCLIDAYERGGAIKYRNKYVGCTARGILEEVSDYNDDTVFVMPDDYEECYIDPSEDW